MILSSSEIFVVLLLWLRHLLVTLLTAIVFNCFGPVRFGENIIGSVRGRDHKIYYFSVRSGSGQKITGQYGVGVPKTLPRRTLVQSKWIQNTKFIKFMWLIEFQNSGVCWRTGMNVKCIVFCYNLVVTVAAPASKWGGGDLGSLWYTDACICLCVHNKICFFSNMPRWIFMILGNNDHQVQVGGGEQ